MFTKKLLLMILIIILILPGTNIFSEFPVISASPEPPNEDANPPINGNGTTEFNQTWYVDTNETLYYGNQTINLTGNLIINSTGKLIFYNVTLLFNCSADNEYGIEVLEGGAFNLTETTISSRDNNTYSFEVYGNMSMEDCNISRMYAEYVISAGEFIGGLEIYNENVTLNNSYFHHNYNNLYVHYKNQFGKDVQITNNTITSSLLDEDNEPVARGIISTDYSEPVIVENNITLQQYAIEVLEHSKPFIDHNNITYNFLGGIYSDSVANNITITYNTIGESVEYDAIWLDRNVVLGGGSSAIIANNTLYNCTDSGIYYTSSEKSLIVDNHIYGNTEQGIYFDDSTTRVYNNVIENNTWVGIYIEGYNYPNPLIQKNEIKYNGNAVTSGGYGVYIDSCTGRVTDNIIEHNGPKNGTQKFQGGGILITSTDPISNPRIDNNTIRYNDRDGIDVDEHNLPVIEDNVIEYNNRTGIYFIKTSVPLSRNTVRYNRIGIHLENSDANIIHSAIEHNSDYGLYLEQRSSPVIYDNTLNYNGNDNTGDSAVFLNGVAGGCGAKIYSNDISNNSGYGVRIVASSPTIEDNDINYNIRGLFFNSCGGTVRNNGIRYNTGTGIMMNKSGASPTFEDNVIDYNNIGVAIHEDSRATINHNWFRHNEIGIKVSGYAWPYVNDSIVHYNTRGLRMEYSRIELTNTYFSDNSQVGIDILGSNFTINNCSIKNSGTAEIRLDDNSHVSCINTSFDKSKVMFNDLPSELLNKWFLFLDVEDESGQPLVDGDVVVKNKSGKMVYGRRIPDSGRINYITLQEFQMMDIGTTYNTPHAIHAEKDGYVKYDQEVTMDISKSVKLTLAENLDPTKVKNIGPKISHTLTPMINWTPAVDLDGDIITYYVNIGSTDVYGNDIIDNSSGMTTKSSFQIVEPLSFGDGNNTYFIAIYADDGRGGLSIAWSQMNVINYQPRAPSIEIIPAFPNKITGLSCKITTPSTDDDNDTIKYNFKWYKNSEYQPPLSQLHTANLSSYISPEYTEDGEIWKCVVQAYDGFIYSPNVESKEILIKNFKPRLNETEYNIEINEDTSAVNAFKLDRLFVDDNDEELTYDWNTSKYVKITEDDLWISFIPKENWFGEVKFKFTAYDYFSEISIIVKVTVRSVNDLPVFEPIGNLILNEDKWFNYTFKAHDYADGDMIIIETNITEVFSNQLLTSLNYNFKPTGELELKPDNGMVGNYSIRVIAVDSRNGRSNVTVNLTIFNVNDKPVPEITSPKADQRFQKGEDIILDGSTSYDEDEIHGDTIVNIRWMLEDGTILGTRLSDVGSIDKPGTHKIYLRLTDTEGDEGSASVTVIIEKGAESGPDEGPLGAFANSPAAVAGLSIVMIVVIMIIISFVVVTLRSRREKKKMVEAGLLTPEDLKKAAEKSGDDKSAAAIVIPQPDTPAGLDDKTPTPVTPDVLPAEPEAGKLAEGEEIKDAEVIEKPEEPSALEAKETPKLPPAEQTGPAWGPAISMDSVEDGKAEKFELGDTMPTPESAEGESLTYSKPEPDEEAAKETDSAVSQPTPPAAPSPVQLQQQPPQGIAQPQVQQPVSGTYPAAPAGQMIPQFKCPDCESPAQIHPMNRRVLICPICGPMKFR